MTTQTLPNLASIVHQSEAAAEKAARLRAEALAADREAEEAAARVQAEQASTLRRYLDKLTQEHPQARIDALNAQADARAALESAVRDGDGDIFACYRAWTKASIALWQVDAELQQARDFNGLPSRETPMPTFSFGDDVGRILNQLSNELQDQALQAIQDRRRRFMRGQENES